MLEFYLQDKKGPSGEEIQSVRGIYYALYSAIIQHRDSFSIVWEEADENADREILRRFLFLVLAEYPELFYVNFDKSEVYFKGNTAEIRFRYVFSKKECQFLKKKIEKKIFCLILVAKCLYKEKEEKVIRYLYCYFVTHISYAGEQLKSRDERELCRIHSAAGVFLDGRAVCDGIARAFKLVLDKLGIENRVIRRELKKGAEFSHEWNVIKLYGDELHADITWEMDVYTLHNRMRFEFFLLTENEMEVKHRKGKEQECFKKRKK